MATIVLERSVIPGAMGFAILSEIPDRNPRTDDGRDFDFWLNNLTGVLFRKEAGVWVSKFTIRPKQGRPGDTGARGLSILSGIGAPGPSIGRSGEFYIEVDVGGMPISIRGPRTVLGWPSEAVPFTKLIVGSGAPSNGLGYDGQDYIDRTNFVFYGPKAGGVWPAGVSFAGAPPWGTPTPWATGVAYVSGPPPASAVLFGGSSYVCIVSHTSGPSFDPSKWQLIAAKGADGLGTGSVNPVGAPVTPGHGVIFANSAGTQIQSTGAPPLTRARATALAIALG